MAKKARPWFWRDAWYVQFGGQRHYLGPHPQGAAKPKKSPKTGIWNSPKAIDEKCKEVTEGKVVPADPRGKTVIEVLDKFITWSKENREPRTAERYKDFCQSFMDHRKDRVKMSSLRVGQLTSEHVTHWLASKPRWKSTTQKNAITALQRGFNWAVKNLGLERNPIKGMEKPEAKAPKTIITPKEFETAIEHALPAFRDLLTVSYDSGARPREIKKLEARHIELAKERTVIPADEAKGKRRVRVIYLPTERSLSIVRRLCELYPTGPIFRNERGRPWTAMAVKCAFARLDGVLGKLHGEPKKRITHSHFRRTFITRKIKAKIDSHVVAKLAGHTSTAMIDKHYSAIADDHDFMLGQAKVGDEPGKEKGPEA